MQSSACYFFAQKALLLWSFLIYGQIQSHMTQFPIQPYFKWCTQHSAHLTICEYNQKGLQCCIPISHSTVPITVDKKGKQNNLTD